MIDILIFIDAYGEKGHVSNFINRILKIFLILILLISKN